MQCEFHLAIVLSKHDGVEHFEPGIALFVLKGDGDENKLLRLDDFAIHSLPQKLQPSGERAEL